jgi:RNA-directed DNA polymerase
VEYLGRCLAGPGRYYWCIEGDITSYFDTIHHRKLMKLLRRRIADKAILDLIWRFLKAGIMEKGVYRETIAGTPQGGIVSPLLANIYLHELDRYMEKNHLALSDRERMKRRRNGMANFLYARYADDWVALSNGTRAQTVAFCEELRQFLKTTLRLELSIAKTKVTHLTEGFQFLGFHIERSLGRKGIRVPRIRIPQTAQKRLLDKMMRMLAPNTHEDAVNAKFAALNKVIGGWCRYYQHSSGPARTFSRLSNRIFWLVAHWLGRKYQLRLAQVMQKFYRDGMFQTNAMTLVLPQRYKPKRYKLSVKPNPYTHNIAIEREELPQLDTVWIGGSNRNADIRAEIRATLGSICSNCGTRSVWSQLYVDHKRPVRAFPSLRQADGQGNHRILCRPCHTAKAKSDRQVLSRVR